MVASEFPMMLGVGEQGERTLLDIVTYGSQAGKSG